MSYLLDAMQHLGIYYTPPHVSRLIGSRRDAWSVVAGNPPFGRACQHCKGSGYVKTKSGKKVCRFCNGTGQVQP